MKLSKEMEKCLAAVRQQGTLVRYRGGFWSAKDVEMKGPPDDLVPIWWYGFGTIEALLKRELLTVTEYKIGKYGKFAIAVEAMTTGD